MCSQHNKPSIGTICGEDYCIECSEKYQETLKEKNPDKSRHPGEGKITTSFFHGHVVWEHDGKEQ